MTEKELQFLTVNTKTLWEQGSLDGLEVTGEGLGLKKVFTHRFAGVYAGVPNPVSFDVDGCGLIYSIEEVSGRVSVFDPKTGSCRRLSPLPITALQGLAAGRANLYLTDGSRLYALAKINYQTRWEAPVSGAASLAAGEGEILYLLDLPEGRVYKAGADASVSVVIEDLGSPLAICWGLDGFLYVLKETAVLRFDSDGTLQETVDFSPPLDLVPRCLAVDRDGVLYIGGQDEDGFSYRLDRSGNWERLGYQGAVYQLCVNKRGDLFLLTRERKSGEKRIVLLERVANHLGEGTYVSSAFDSKIEGCRWHRFVLDAEIPDNTQLLVSYGTGESPSEAGAAFGEELANPPDALITGAGGRYIRFKFRFYTKDVYRTPRIRSLKVYFPRVSYLRYLPAVYQEDGQGRDFLERFLAIGETFFSELEGKIRDISTYLDPAAVPEGFLQWLASWLAVTRYNNWPAPKIRALLQRAPELYRKRGTREGIEAMITLFLSRVSENGLDVDETGARPVIVESFQVQAGAPEARAVWADLFGTDPYRFCVLLRPEQVSALQDLNAVKRIVESEKPAYTSAGVKVLQPWFYLDWHTYLGVNTCLSRQGFVLGRSVLSRDTALDEAEDGGEISVRSRAGVDTVLT